MISSQAGDMGWIGRHPLFPGSLEFMGSAWGYFVLPDARSVRPCRPSGTKGSFACFPGPLSTTLPFLPLSVSNWKSKLVLFPQALLPRCASHRPAVPQLSQEVFCPPNYPVLDPLWLGLIRALWSFSLSALTTIIFLLDSTSQIQPFCLL